MLLSVLIATFNRFKYSSLYIPQILQRIGNVEHEILIWDNCSNDGTFDWLLELQQTYPRIRNIKFSDKNIGMQAFNELANAARGKYLLKVDDDIEVPEYFGERLLSAYEEVNEPKLAYLGWDMRWGNTTFAIRSGLSLYMKKNGKISQLSNRDSVYISYNPGKWMINGVCRLCKKETFLELGGHPKGILYGVDAYVSRQAQKHGYWTGFLHTKDMVVHCGEDASEYRRFKDKQLDLAKAPKHV